MKARAPLCIGGELDQAPVGAPAGPVLVAHRLRIPDEDADRLGGCVDQAAADESYAEGGQRDERDAVRGAGVCQQRPAREA